MAFGYYSEKEVRENYGHLLKLNTVQDLMFKDLPAYGPRGNIADAFELDGKPHMADFLRGVNHVADRRY